MIFLNSVIKHYSFLCGLPYLHGKAKVENVTVDLLYLIHTFMYFLHYKIEIVYALATLYKHTPDFIEKPASNINDFCVRPS